MVNDLPQQGTGSQLSRATDIPKSTVSTAAPVYNIGASGLQIAPAAEVSAYNIKQGMTGAPTVAMPTTTTPSQAAMVDKTNPAYMGRMAQDIPELQKGFSQGLDVGSMRYYDPNTNQAVNVDTIRGAGDQAAREAFNQKYAQKYTDPGKQSMSDLQKQGDIAKQQYDAWRARVDAQPAYKMQAGPTIAPKSERMAQERTRADMQAQAEGRKFSGEQAQADRDNKLKIAQAGEEGEKARAQAMAGQAKNQMTLGDMSSYRAGLVEEQQQFAPGKDGKWASEDQKFEYNKRQRLIDEMDVEAQRRIAGGERPATAQAGQGEGGVIQDGATGTFNGKKVKRVGGKWVPA